MITIIHGDDMVHSRKFFVEKKNNLAHPVSLNGATLQTADLAQIMEGGMLFAADKNVFIEDLFARKRAKSKDLTEIVDYINKNHEFADVTLWEGKELTKSQLTSFKKADIKQFKLPQNIFSFLDNVFNKNPKDRIKLFHSALENAEEDMVFFLLVRQIRLLLALSDGKSEQIDEVKRLSPWQKNKLLNQMRYFSFEKLKKLYKKLYEIDYGQKTGKTPMNLVQSIDFLLLSI